MSNPVSGDVSTTITNAIKTDLNSGDSYMNIARRLRNAGTALPLNVRDTKWNARLVGRVVTSLRKTRSMKRLSA